MHTNTMYYAKETFAMERYATWVIRHRWLVIVIASLLTAFLGSQARKVTIVIDPAAVVPQSHPYIKTTNHIEKVFGSKYLVLIGISPKQGDAFQPLVLETIVRMTNKLRDTPNVVKTTLLSLGAKQAKSIAGTTEGFEARPLMDRIPYTSDEVTALKRALNDNPIYQNTVVSADERSAAILVELKEPTEGFQNMMEPVRTIVEQEKDPGLDIMVGGNPVFLEQAETFSERINILFPIAVFVIGLLHFEAFRTTQGLFLPLLTALCSVVWGIGIMGAFRFTLDIFNSPTPILILAVAAGHAVQLLKRYYEEYNLIRTDSHVPANVASEEAIIRSLVGVGPVMMIAGGVASLGFFSLMIFDMATIRTFGLFTGVGILSAVVLEMTFIPAVRSLLPAPGDSERIDERKRRVWDWIPEIIGRVVITQRGRRSIYVAFLLLCLISGIGMALVQVDNSSKSFFSQDLAIQRDDALLNDHFGGTNSLYIMVEGIGPDAIKDPSILQFIDNIQRFLEQQPNVGKTMSIVDFLKRMNKAAHNDDSAYFRVPESRELVSQYLLLYSMSGDPGDFDSYIDYDYKAAKLAVLLKTSNNAYIEGLTSKLLAFTAAQSAVEATVSVGGEVAQTMALTEVMVRSKLLNIAQICGAVFMITTIVFRSVYAGLIVLIPLLIAVLTNFGVMGLTGIPLNIPNSLISAMAVGIGADYAIYLLYRVREYRTLGQAESDAVCNTLATAGKASLYVASAVAGGYGVLLLSFGYNVHIWLATFIMLAMLTSTVASLTLVPAVILSFPPHFLNNDATRRTPVGAISIAALVVVGLLAFSHYAHAAEDNARTIMEKNFAVTKVADSIANATFTLVNSSGAARVRKTIAITKLQANGRDNMRLVRFIYPADIKGTSTLMIEHTDNNDDMWVFLPELRKVRRLGASNKKDSFVGTDFSYGDVIGYRVEDWGHTLLREESVEGVSCYVIESLPNNDEVRDNSGYSKRWTWVRTDNYMTVKSELWDQAGQLFKRTLLSDIRSVGKRGDKWEAMHSEAINLQTGHKTIIHYDEYRADQNVGDEYFSPRYMEKN